MNKTQALRHPYCGLLSLSIEICQPLGAEWMLLQGEYGYSKRLGGGREECPKIYEFIVITTHSTTDLIFFRNVV